MTIWTALTDDRMKAAEIICYSDLWACFGQAKAIYGAASAADRLELDFFPSEHGWGGNKSVEFFRRWLGEAPAPQDGSKPVHC